MAQFDVETYREKLAALQEEINEMSYSVDGLMREHGTGGMSDRTEHYLGELNEGVDRIVQAKAEVAREIIRHRAESE